MARYLKVSRSWVYQKAEAFLQGKSAEVSPQTLNHLRGYLSRALGGRAESIPVATELVPFLRVAMAASPSELVFPKLDGTMMRRDVNLEMTLRRALGRAGAVEGYRHACRRQGRGHSAEAKDQAQRRCPKDGRKLWVKGRG